MKEQILINAEALVRSKIIRYDSGHDWWHIERVRKLASYINKKEKMDDPLMVDLAAIFHDFVDSKFTEADSDERYDELNKFLFSNKLRDINTRLLSILKNVSFSSKIKSGNIYDPVLLIIQDADRLDAIGAIGIARAFNYGGFRNNSIYSPGKDNSKNSTINHFYEKLLLLKSMMNTNTAKELANERHQFLEAFLDQFYREWNLDLER
jgi:uncharacterized protein